MIFSRFIFVSSALFAGSAAAFSVQPATSMPKTALYASNSDNEGVLERRQVLASLAATAAASLGASAAFAFNTPDLSAGGNNAANTLKENAREIEKNVFDRPNMDPGDSMKQGEKLGQGMNSNIGIGKAADNVKSDVKSVADNLNPFSGGNNMGNNMAMGNPVGDAADKVKSAASNLPNPLQGGNNMGKNMAMGGGNGNMDKDNYGKGLSNSLGLNNNNNLDIGNPVDKVKSAADSLPNPFSGGNNMGNNMAMGGGNGNMDKDNYGKGLSNSLGLNDNNKVANKVKSDVDTVSGKKGGFNLFSAFSGNNNPNKSTKGDNYEKGLTNSLGLGNVSQNEKKDFAQIASGSNQFPSAADK